ncbi:MAG TPA: serine/threonine-protein kinase [Thermoanaerobaculia bacterium]|jgi:serine/threonine protein kinase|nr:serine/threonine-protein kinase [Thermoanaerobaculia bacterium]
MPPLTASDPRQCGDYDVESLLGKGSIGKVYLARHRRFGRYVALKVVQGDQRFEDDEDQSDFYKRLQREAELCGALQHPNIVTLYDVGYAGERVEFLATEYVDGETLLARLKRTRPLPLAEALSIGADILRALAYAHAKGIIHRDIKPANILLTSEGQAKIADFGIARRLESSLTGINLLVGTPNYMSPEQVRSAPVTTRSDLFSAGVVLYEMLTGAKPFASQELSSVLYNVVNLDPPLASEAAPHVPEPVARAVQKLMAKAPADRYATAAEALDDLVHDGAGMPEPELVTDPLDVETLAVDRARHIDTTPLPTYRELFAPEPSLLRRPIPLAIAMAVIISIALVAGASLLVLRQRVTREQALPVARAPVAELQEKRATLDAARAAANSGNHDDAIRLYDAYLSRWPNSSVARDERASVQTSLSSQKITVSAPKRRVPATTAAAKEETPQQPAKKPSRWQRLKSWFKGS